MTDRVTANLPSRDLGRTAAFYAGLGFAEAFRDDDWMILERGGLTIEVFPHPEVDPLSSCFSACVRVHDLDALHAAWGRAGLPPEGVPRMTGLPGIGHGLRMFAAVDPDGSLLRCIGPA